MNMSYQKLENLISRFPSEKDALERLNALMLSDTSSIREQQKIYPIARLLDKVGPNSQYSFVEIVSYLVEEGMMKRILRVESPKTRTGLGDYESIEDIPKNIHDETTDENIDVSPQDIKLYYKFNAHND
jgi:hypothetical protein